MVQKLLWKTKRIIPNGPKSLQENKKKDTKKHYFRQKPTTQICFLVCLFFMNFSLTGFLWIHTPSHGLCAQRGQRTKSRGLKGLQLELKSGSRGPLHLQRFDICIQDLWLEGGVLTCQGVISDLVWRLNKAEEGWFEARTADLNPSKCWF